MKVVGSIKVPGGPDDMEITPTARSSGSPNASCAASPWSISSRCAWSPRSRSANRRTGCSCSMSGNAAAGPLRAASTAEDRSSRGASGARPSSTSGWGLRTGSSRPWSARLLFRFDLMEWFEPAFNAVEIVMLGIVQVAVIALGMRFFEKRWPLEKTRQTTDWSPSTASTRC